MRTLAAAALGLTLAACAHTERPRWASEGRAWLAARPSGLVLRAVGKNVGGRSTRFRLALARADARAQAELALGDLLEAEAHAAPTLPASATPDAAASEPPIRELDRYDEPGSLTTLVLVEVPLSAVCAQLAERWELSVTPEQLANDAPERLLRK